MKCESCCWHDCPNLSGVLECCQCGVHWYNGHGPTDEVGLIISDAAIRCGVAARKAAVAPAEPERKAWEQERASMRLEIAGLKGRLRRRDDSHE